MRRSFGITVFILAACATPAPPEAPVVPASSASGSPAPVGPNAPPGAAPVCGPQPVPPVTPTSPTCTSESLRDGRTWHDQLNVQTSSGAFSRIDCPRMRFLGRDTPSCVMKIVGGRIRGGCCPPGHSDPTDPACVNEGTIDEMFKRQRAWEWCDKDHPPSRPCEPCVWVTDARRN